MTKRAAPTKKYLERAKAFAEAIDLATAVRKAALGPKADLGMSRFEKKMETKALEPEPAFAKLASLKYLEAAFFTYWNESPVTSTSRRSGARWRSANFRSIVETGWRRRSHAAGLRARSNTKS